MQGWKTATGILHKPAFLAFCTVKVLNNNANWSGKLALVFIWMPKRMESLL